MRQLDPGSIPGASTRKALENKAPENARQTPHQTGRVSWHAEAARLAFDRGYRVTESGRVVSPTGRVRSQYVHARKRYALVSVRVQGRASRFYVHKLAAYQWFGEAAFAPGVQVRHLNGDSLDNSKANIALGTATENAFDKSPEVRRAMALHAASAVRRLTDDQARELVTLSEAGWTGKRLAEHFGIRRSTVSEILSGKLYSAVTGLEQGQRGAVTP